MTAAVSESDVLSYRLSYSGVVRHVDNVTVEEPTRTLIGFEMRRGGRFSYRVKRYKVDEIGWIERIEPMQRQGPRIGRPEGMGA